MSRINPEGQLTRKERLVTVIAVVGAVLVHAVALFGWGRIYRWTQEEQKKERLMVIRRVRDIAPQRDAVPTPSGRRAPADVPGRVGTQSAAPPPKGTTVKEEGPEPAKQEEISPKMEEDLQEQKPEEAKGNEQGANTVNVVTDLPGATFVVGGPQEFRGAGTFWVRKGAPPGTYTVTFNPVPGFSTPPVQTKELAAAGQIVFVGKYRKSVEVVIECNIPAAGVAVYRPDGSTLEIAGVGRAFYEDLPNGVYTAVFKAVPGYVTPPPVSRALAPGGRLSFLGEYKADAAGRVGATAGEQGQGAGEVARSARPGTASGSGIGGGVGRSGKPVVKSLSGPSDAALDRRVQVVVESYPRSRIDEDHGAIPYPEMIVRKSNFQQGWCQVYLVLRINGSGEVEKVLVERPRPEERSRYEALIQAVERSVREWDYNEENAEVHVDARFYVE